MKGKIDLQHQKKQSKKQVYCSFILELGNENKDEELLDFGIKGTCTKLEKQYFRLSGPPDPSSVRPEEVLQKSLKMLKRKWKHKEAEYAYICDQLRSIRQDMMVQRIKNEFAVEVYETHARIALESRDISHFNQCQTQLDELYNNGVKGHNDEFLAYRILYAALHQMQIELAYILKKLTLKDKQTKCVQHSLQIVKALSDDNFYSFFRLYKKAPNMGAYLIDLFIDRLRVLALQTISVTLYISILILVSPRIEILVIAEILAFDNDKKCKEFLVSAGGKLNEEGNKLNCKESIQGFKASPILTKKIN